MAHVHVPFSCVSEWRMCMCPFLAFLNGACAHAPCVVLARADFITGCIVLDLLEMHFWSMSELMIFLTMLDSCNHLQTKFQ
jgi:hypothetical protein